MACRAAPNRSPAFVVGYIRVSTDDQHLGPRAQRKTLERWCVANEACLVAVFEDRGVSGGTGLEKRPGLLKALDALATHGAAVLLVAKRDRLARDVVVAAMVERLVERDGSRIQSADGNGNGRGPEAMLMRGIVDLFAQYERAVIRARTCQALAVKRGKGERIGQVPLGFRLADDGTQLVVDPEEDRVVALVHELRTGGLSIRGIADQLNADSVPARGRKWYPTTIARLLNRQAA